MKLACNVASRLIDLRDPGREFEWEGDSNPDHPGQAAIKLSRPPCRRQSRRSRTPLRSASSASGQGVAFVVGGAPVDDGVPRTPGDMRVDASLPKIGDEVPTVATLVSRPALGRALGSLQSGTPPRVGRDLRAAPAPASSKGNIAESSALPSQARLRLPC